MDDAIPIPPRELVVRVGASVEGYLEEGRAQRRILEAMLPSDWSFDGKSVLDLGCGAGRTLSAFLVEAERARFTGCDIDAASIAWASAHLSPPLTFKLCEETPPLPVADAQFDLVYGMSVFTHITDQWSRWLVELHRVMRPGALAIISVLGAAVTERGLGLTWDERIGMASINLHQEWDAGGPSALLAQWWVREHWGRAFEILDFAVAPDAWFDHDYVLMRRRDVEVSAEMLERIDPEDRREYAAQACNLQLLADQQRQLGRQLRDAERAHTTEFQRLTDERGRQQAEIGRLEAALDEIRRSRSWQYTAPLRVAAAAARRYRQPKS